MFEKFKEWWKRVTKFTPPKETKNMTDDECKAEYRKLWDMYAVFNLKMNCRDEYRMCLLESTLKARGYVIYASTVGVDFEKLKK